MMTLGYPNSIVNPKQNIILQKNRSFAGNVQSHRWGKLLPSDIRPDAAPTGRRTAARTVCFFRFVVGFPLGRGTTPAQDKSVLANTDIARD
jgi:hypothetical protein